MIREEVMNSISLKKRFCKNYNLPIAVFDNPYFYERLCTLDVLADCVSKFDQFCNELLNFKNEQEYFEYYNSVKDKVIKAITAKSDYKAFVNSDFKYKSVVNKKNLYVEQNDGKVFISIDMIKANFSALWHYSRSIFEGQDTWKDFISKFTYSKHIIDSKYIRQVIFGACNPKKQIQYEHYLMNILCGYIMKELPNIKIYSLDVDEIIIEVPNNGYDFSLNKLRKVVSSCPNCIGSLVKIVCFQLDNIDYGWLKTYYTDDDKVEFKCINSEIYHQIVKHYYNKPITENDLVFYYNGQLAKFIKEVNNPWS